MIPGWDQGVAGMKVGGRRRITIPPDLAYGKRGAGGVIGPDETLVFVVDLIGVPLSGGGARQGPARGRGAARQGGDDDLRRVPLDDAGLRALAGRLKKRCGVGGSAKDGVIELQGDHRDVVVEVLRADGYDVVLAGG